MFNFFFLGGNTAISAQVQEICEWYAKRHQLALPLSPEQLLNAVAEYAQMATDPHIFFGDADPEYDYRIGDLRFSADWNVYQYTNTGWVLLGNIRGPQGPQGDTGEQGPQGIQGPAGPKGEQGQGLIKRYMHSISYNPTSFEDEPLVKFVIFSSDEASYGNLVELSQFFSENGCVDRESSYPATGVYENEGVVYNVWGIYYYESAGVFRALCGNNRAGFDIGASSGSEVVDTVIDLGS